VLTTDLEVQQLDARAVGKSGPFGVTVSGTGKPTSHQIWATIHPGKECAERTVRHQRGITRAVTSGSVISRSAQHTSRRR
jgi:hypothetical protein